MNPDTKDRAFFYGGCLGAVVQFAGYYLFQIPPSWPLMALTAAALGVPFVTEIDRRRGQ